ncbi:hypothetical protein PHSC3_001691 [Chlamydiales bacterium STE3]|nr:hypothetical protein PHSC3_001691 [Chlamydiales bacterium STE3]
MDVSTRSYQSLLELQDSLLTRFDESSSFSAESFAKDIDTVIAKLWNNQNTAQKSSEDLLKMHKITKKIFTKGQGEAIWGKLNPQSKSFVRTVHPYLIFTEDPGTQTDPASLRRGFPSLFTFPDNQSFRVTLTASDKVQYGFRFTTHYFFRLADDPSTELIFYWLKDDSTYFDYREGLGISKGPKDAVSKKGHRVIREVNNSRPLTLKHWLKAKPTNAMLQSVAQQIIEIFYLEREFGIELYGGYDRLPFIILNNQIYPKLDSSLAFFPGCEFRHPLMIEKCNDFSRYLGSQLIAQYKELKTGPNENIFNVLKEAHSKKLISSEDLQQTDSMAYQIAYALQAAQEKTGRLIAIPWEKIDSAEGLFVYLNFVIRSTTKREGLSTQLFTAAKKLLKNIPRTKGRLKRGLLDRPNHLSQEIESQLSPLFLNENSHSPVFDLIDQLLEETQKSPEKSNKASIGILCSFISQEYRKQNTPSKDLLRERLDELKLRIKEEQHENFIHQDMNIRKDLTAILYAIIIIEYYSNKKTSIMAALYSLIFESPSNKNTSLDGFLDDLLEEIKKQLNENTSLKMVRKQIDKDGRVKDSFYDPVQTPGDYFITLFWQDFHDQLRNLSEHKFAPDPQGDLACLRTLHAVAPYKKEFIGRQLEKVLKDNYKKVSRQKLEKELKSRLEKFTSNP